MVEEFEYQKERKKFGRHMTFDDTDCKIVGSIAPVAATRELYVLRDPNRMTLDNIPQMSEHRVSSLQICNVV
jgi:hypothetical protein